MTVLLSFWFPQAEVEVQAGAFVLRPCKHQPGRRKGEGGLKKGDGGGRERREGVRRKRKRVGGKE